MTRRDGLLHFSGKPYKNCREMGCYSATLGPFCPTHAYLSDEHVARDYARDEERRRWNEALASGDEDRIAEAGRTLLDDVHARIMGDDENYTEAGWTP